jgi:trans-aconitate methyltransferase
MPTPTDWDAYYRKPATFAPLTRRITVREILADIDRLAGHPPPGHIVELGGGNSGFLRGLRERFPDARLTAVDRNALGLELVEREMAGDANVATIERDIFAPSDISDADVVFSVGLIEHFDPDGTARAVAVHFAHVKPGGLVIITFPTPTWLYRLVRGAAELAGVWAFPDERPLQTGEVLREVERHADVLDVRINWPIVLTQAIVVARRR